LIRLHLDLTLELVLAQGPRHLDDFGDGSVAADCDRGVLRRAPDRFTARLMASPTALASTIAFSLIEFGGVASAAYDSTRY